MEEKKKDNEFKKENVALLDKEVNENIEQKEKKPEETKEKKESKDEVKEKPKTEEKEEEKKDDIKIKTLEDAKQEEKSMKVIKDHTKTNIILITTGIIVVIVAILSTIFAVINLGNEKIMKGVYIKGLDVSDMTKQEAKEALETKYLSKEESQIYLNYGEFETAITYKALEVSYQIDQAITDALSIGRSGNIFKDNIEILNTWRKSKDISLEVKIDEDMVRQISQNIDNSIEGAVVQPSYYIEGKKLIITAGKEGAKVDEDKLIELIYKLLNEEKEEQQKIEIPVLMAQPGAIDVDKIHQEVYKQVQDAYYTKDPFTIYPEVEGVDFDVESAKAMLAEAKDEYVVELTITKPSKTVRDIGTEAFPDRLGTCSTKYSANANRTTNLKLAANKINGTVLMPGEEFSYNKTLGERTIQAGYKEAATFSNGEVVNGLGGGICQISSTLYDAVVFANLDVTVRRNHQFVTSYLPAGKDATVVWGSQDFKFKNTRKYPIRIEATVGGSYATINIWGIREDVEYDISIETRKIATIQYTTQYIQDPSLPVGKEVVKQAGSNGRKVEAYKVMKRNGQVVSSTLLSRDTYNAMKRIVRVGTGGQ